LTSRSFSWAIWSANSSRVLMFLALKKKLKW
jgi:hypothetical protein